MSAEQKIDPSSQISFTVTSVDKYDDVDKGVRELYEQILLKSKVPDNIACKIIDSKGCSGFFGKLISNQDKLNVITDNLKNDDFLTGYARVFYPPVVTAGYSADKENTGKYILGASFCKYAKRKSDEVSTTIENKSTVKESESKELEKQFLFYESVKNLGLKLLKEVVLFQPVSHSIIHNVEAHFAKFQEKEDLFTKFIDDQSKTKKRDGMIKDLHSDKLAKFK